MNFLYDEMPIIACSSGGGTNSAISVIRLSGFSTILCLQDFFSTDLSQLRPRYSCRTNILKNKSVVDNVLVIFFKGPDSYNGENILEIMAHGNKLNVRRIIQAFVEKGLFRLAKEGEFTYRALINKKLTLSQVEGLDLFLNANSSLMLSQGINAMQGELYQKYQELNDLYLKLRASVELSVDFLEDIGEEEARSIFNKSFNEFFELLTSLYHRTKGDYSSLTSPSVLLIGQTNAGKSSLFNKMLRTNRSIVSPTPGTTRDYVSEFLYLEDTNFKLIDSAGLRSTGHQIERMGIERTHDLASKAFFRIFVINPFETDEEGLKELSKEKFDLLVFTHADCDNFENRINNLKWIPAHHQSMQLSLKEEVGPIEPDIKSGSIGPDIKSGSIGPIAKGGPIEPDLKVGPIGPEYIFELIAQKYKECTAQNPILLDRHREAIGNIYSKTLSFQEIIQQEDDIAIVSSELNIVGNYISELIGIITPSDILSSIFRNFCIGK